MVIKFSFIVPTRNEAAYIGDCLKSIRNQTRKDYEIIVADTMSGDNTKALAKRYADKVAEEPMRGPAPARNTGARLARGDILIFADADVRFEPDFLDKLDFELSKHPTAVGGIFKIRTYDAKSALIVKSYRMVDLFARFFNSIGIPITSGCCFVYKRSAFESTGGFDINLLTNEDHDMAKRASKLGRFLYFGNISINTSSRRVAKYGLRDMVVVYVKSTLIYLLNGGCIKNYWQ